MTHSKAAWQRQKYVFALMIAIGGLWLLFGDDHAPRTDARIEVLDTPNLSLR